MKLAHLNRQFSFHVMFIIAALVVCSVAVAADEPKAMRSFLESHCYDCHDTATKKQGLDLQSLRFDLDSYASSQAWEKILDRVRAGEMPPAKSEQPAPAERATFAQSLHDAMYQHSKAKQQTAGRTILRRLNRTEWENTVHDLLGVDMPLAFLLPQDTPMHGFDTVAQGLRLSPLHMEGYLEAADIAIAAAFDLNDAPKRESKRYTYKEEKGIRENLDTPEGKVTDPNSTSKHHIIFGETDDAVIFYSDTYSPTHLKQFRPNGSGLYRFKLSAYGYQSEGRHVTALIYVSDHRTTRLAGYYDMPPDKPRVAEFEIELAHNEHIRIAPYDTGYDDKGKNIWAITGPQFKGVGLAVQWVEIDGPIFEIWPPKSVTRLLDGLELKELPANKRPWRNGRKAAYEIVTTDPPRDLARLIERFAARAFRRPLQTGEAQGFVKLGADALAAGQDFEAALRLSMRAILTSPQFLLFEEAPGKLTDHALASRLSYFLWSTMPDEELLKLADAKKLTDAKEGARTLATQVERMLKSPKASAFTTNFAGQWLDLRRIDATSPDARLYPEFDELLKHAMIGETEAFFDELLRYDLSVSNFITSDFAMLNRRIAEHYNIDGVTGEQFQRTKLAADSPRGGLLTQASILKVTANGSVTSPVMRGSWVMERLLGDPPSPPPPGVGSVEPDTRGTTTIREQLDKHRNVESCASCHRKIDPPGFAMESFDVIGGYRERYRSKEKGDRPDWTYKGRGIHEYKLALPVDASGQTADGIPFKNIREFKAILMTQNEQIARNVTQNLLIYGTGAGIEFADRAAVDAIMKQTAGKDHGLRSIVHAIVQSEVFQSK